MNFNMYVKLFNKLTLLNTLSVSKQKIFKTFLKDEYNASLTKKNKLKIGQLKFHYNPITVDKYVTFPNFELKSNASSSATLLQTSTKSSFLMKFVTAVFCILIILFFKNLI